MNKSLLRRRVVNIVGFGITGLCALATTSVLFGLLGYLLVKGFSALSWDFLTQLPAPVGETGGGMANAIVGSAKLLALGTSIGVPIGFFGGIYLVYFSGHRFAFVVRFATDLLNGVPSIVVGIVVYTLLVLPMRKFTTLAGGVALGIMMIPIALRSTEEFLKMVPLTIREASLALGIPEWKTIVFVLIPAAVRGLVAGMLLDIARVAGETAPLLFTALNNRVWSHGWLEPTASLPVMIYTYSIAPYEDWHRQAWAAGLLLLASVLGMNIVARSILPSHKEG